MKLGLCCLYEGFMKLIYKILLCVHNVDEYRFKIFIVFKSLQLIWSLFYSYFTIVAEYIVVDLTLAYQLIKTTKDYVIETIFYQVISHLPTRNCLDGD